MDGESLSQHFGQSKGFVVFEVEGTKVVGRQFRTGADTPHNDGLCDHGEQSGARGHGGILELLGDCSVVLCGGMGAGAAQSLVANGIKPVIVPGSRTTDEAVAAYISGNSVGASADFCNCQH